MSGCLVIMHIVKHVLYSYLPEHTRSWGGVMLHAGSSFKYGKLHFWSITFLCPVCFADPDFLFILNNSYANDHFVHFHQIYIWNVTFALGFTFTTISITQSTQDVKHTVTLTKCTVAVTAKNCGRIFMCDSDSYFINLSVKLPLYF